MNRSPGLVPKSPAFAFSVVQARPLCWSYLQYLHSRLLSFSPSTRANGLLLVWLLSPEARTALRREGKGRGRFFLQREEQNPSISITNNAHSDYMTDAPGFAVALRTAAGAGRRASVSP